MSPRSWTAMSERELAAVGMEAEPDSLTWALADRLDELIQSGKCPSCRGTCERCHR